MMPAAPRKLRVGFLVNPVSGLGGRPGWKGTDDAERVRDLVSGMEWNDEVHAFARGATCVQRLDGARLVLVTPQGVLGEDVVKAGTRYGGPVFEIARVAGPPPVFGATTRDDTRRAVSRLKEAGIDLLLFVGGDGTAIDVATAAGPDLAMLGVPAGVKMFSPVFAETPTMAALVVNGLAPDFERAPVDVVDLDESSYRDGTWRVRAQAVAVVPQGDAVQAGKSGAGPPEAEAAQALAAWFREEARPGTSYVLGSGATVGAIKSALGGGSPLGVDVWRDGAFVAVDAGEDALLEALGEEGPAQIVVSPTGTQGAVLGRGTAQISVAVLERVGPDNVVVVATPGKLLGLRLLFVDTGDADLDRSFPEYVKVRTDPDTEKVMALRRGPPDGR